MEQPQPRVALGVALRGVATSAIDLSDGLLGDLGHVLRASRVGAAIDADVLPRSPALAAQPQAVQRECTLAGGDDYELLFTAPPAMAQAVKAASARAQLVVTRIGRIAAAPGLRVHDAHGQALAQTYAGFDHFRT
jgi:thiamine-monophosphate kinase